MAADRALAGIFFNHAPTGFKAGVAGGFTNCERIAERIADGFLWV